MRTLRRTHAVGRGPRRAASRFPAAINSRCLAFFSPNKPTFRTGGAERGDLQAAMAMALRVAVRSLGRRSLTGGKSAAPVGAWVSSAVKTGGRRAFMSTRTGPNDHLFAEPAFPMPAAEDPALWLEKYARPDPADMWKVGSFPVQDGALQEEDEDGSEDSPMEAVASSGDLWDTAGMLSALGEGMPLRDADSSRNVEVLLSELDGYRCDSVLKKRRKKMNKHKHRKRKKALRMRTKKN